MNSFKFVVRPEFSEVQVSEHFINHCLQIDITTIMQYLCIHDLILDSKYKREFNFYVLLSNDSERIIKNVNNNFISLCTQVFDLQYKRENYTSYYTSHKDEYLCKNGEYIDKNNIYKLFTFDHGSFDKYLELLNTDDNSSVLCLRLRIRQENYTYVKYYISFEDCCVNKGIYRFNNNKIIKKISDDYLKQLINTRKRIHNTMSDLVVYTDDSEIIKQVIRNNQEIINELKNSDKCDNYIEKNRTDLCNKLCKKQKTTVCTRKSVSIE